MQTGNQPLAALIKGLNKQTQRRETVAIDAMPDPVTVPTAAGIDGLGDEAVGKPARLPRQRGRLAVGIEHHATFIESRLLELRQLEGFHHPTLLVDQLLLHRQRGLPIDPEPMTEAQVVQGFDVQTHHSPAGDTLLTPRVIR